MSRQVAAKYATHMIAKLADKCRRVGRNLTLEAAYTKPSDELLNLWSHQVEMSEVLTERASEISNSEPHRAVMLVMAARLDATVARNADTMYRTCDDFLADLRVVQRSLAEAGAVRAAYGPVQTSSGRPRPSASTWWKWNSVSTPWCTPVRSPTFASTASTASSPP